MHQYNEAELKNLIEDAFWAGYNARSKQLKIVLDNTFESESHYKRENIDEREVLEKVIKDKLGIKHE